MSDIKSTTARKLAEELVNRVLRAKEELWETGVQLGRVERRAESAEARVEELTEENARLEKENADCEKFRVANVGGLMRANRELKSRVEELTTENERLEQEATAYDLRISRLAKELDGARDEIRRLRTENERLENAARHDRTWRWDELCEHAAMEASMARPEDVIEVLSNAAIMGHSRTAVPRVIRPDEIAPGKKLLFVHKAWDGLRAQRGTVETVRGPGIFVTLREKPGTFRLADAEHIVLLKDAPEDEDEGDGQSGIAMTFHEKHGTEKDREPERRGPIINWRDLRDGDVADFHHRLGLVHRDCTIRVDEHGPYSEKRPDSKENAIDATSEVWSEIRLVSRPTCGRPCGRPCACPERTG